MDIFKKITQNSAADLSVFRTKRSAKAPAQDKTEENQAEPIPMPKPEQAEGQSIPVEPKGLPVQADETAESPVIMESIEEAEPKAEEMGRVIQFKQPENLNEEAAIKLEAELETAKSTLVMMCLQHWSWMRGKNCPSVFPM